MKQISILGCGWLGLPLAKALLAKGFLVKGSTTSFSKITTLEAAGIHTFLIVLGVSIQGEIDLFLNDSELLIIDIPPKLRKDLSENFVEKIKTLIPFIEQSSVKKVLFVSSTSVYADDDSIVTEQTIPSPETESGKQLLDVEKLLHSNKHFQTTTIRFGGLIGEDRHPIHFLAGKSNIENPDAPINLIHQQDCIQIIKKIIEKNYWGEIYNAVTPFHPSRKDYYIEKAKKLNLMPPLFNNNQNSRGKTIDSTKLITELRYDFKKLD